MITDAACDATGLTMKHECWIPGLQKVNSFYNLFYGQRIADRSSVYLYTWAMLFSVPI